MGKSLSFCILCGFLLSFLFTSFGPRSNSLHAQELTFSGIGPVNHGMAGVAVAMPRDSAGAIQWNPGTVSFLNQSEFEIGLGRHNAPWYGDESVGYAVMVPAVVVVGFLILVNEADDDDTEFWRSGRSNNKSHKPEPEPEPEPEKIDPEPVEEVGPRLLKIRVPTLSFVYRKPNSRWSYGLGISEYGARKTGMLFDEHRNDIVGICQYRIQGFEFIPTVSYRENRRLSYGVSAVFSIDESENNSLPVISGGQGTTVQNDRGKFGIGVQYGVYYMAGRRWRLGFSIRSPQWIDGYAYRWTDPVSGKEQSKSIGFSQDSATRIAFGTAYTGYDKWTTYSADFRYYNYSHVAALYDIPSTFDPDVRKLGVKRGVYSFALGLEHRLKEGEGIILRLGYQFNLAPRPDKAILYNTTLPIQTGHSIHYGITFPLKNAHLSFSASHGFGGGWETIQTADGPVSYRKNPNRSNFWVAFQFFY